MITTLLMLKCLVALVIPIAACSVMLLFISCIIICTGHGKRYISDCARVGKFLYYISLIVSAVGLTLIIIATLLKVPLS